MQTFDRWQRVFLALVLLIAGLSQELALAADKNGLHGTVVVSAKFIEARGTPLANSEREEQLRVAVAEANGILVRSGAFWNLALEEVVDIEVEASDAVLVTANAHRKLEARAIVDTTYAWRPDAINVYFARHLGGRGICSLPSQGEIVVFDNTAGTLDGVLLLHELGHYLSLTHTFECFHSYCDVDVCSGAGALHRAPRGEINCPDTCPQEGNVMSYTWPLAEDARLSPCQLAEIEHELRDPTGNRGAVHRLHGAPAPFRRGNADGNLRVDMTDATTILGGLFLPTEALSCQDAADINDSGTVDVTDAIHLLGYLFLGSAPPTAPFLTCGPDATPDALSCVAPPPCDSM